MAVKQLWSEVLASKTGGVACLGDVVWRRRRVDNDGFVALCSKFHNLELRQWPLTNIIVLSAWRR